MSLFFDLYNLFAVLVYSVSLGLCFWAYGCTEKKDLRHAGFFMLVCVCDSVYMITQDLLDFKYSTHTLVLTAALVSTLAKIYILGKIKADIFGKDLSPEFHILLCMVVIVHGLFSTSLKDLYWQLDPISFNISVLIICGSYWYSLVQETNAARRQRAARYKQIVLIMLVFSSFALLYMVSTLSLFAAVLSRSYMDLCTISFCLVLAVWYMFFCRRELWSRAGDAAEDLFDPQVNDPPVLDPGRISLLPAEQLDGLFRQYELTEREREILQLILSGKSNQEISELLYITVGTVKAHVHSIFGKLDVSRRSQLITRFLDYDGK